MGEDKKGRIWGAGDPRKGESIQWVGINSQKEQPNHGRNVWKSDSKGGGEKNQKMQRGRHHYRGRKT